MSRDAHLSTPKHCNAHANSICCGSGTPTASAGPTQGWSMVTFLLLYVVHLNSLA